MIRLSVSGFHAPRDASLFVIVAPSGIGARKNIVMTSPTATISGVVRSLEPLVVEGVADISTTAGVIAEGWNEETQTLTTPSVSSSYSGVYAAIDEQAVCLGDIVSAVRVARKNADDDRFRHDALPFEIVVEGLAERELMRRFPGVRPKSTTTMAYVAGVVGAEAAFFPGSAACRAYSVAAAIRRAYQDGDVVVSFDDDVCLWFVYVRGVSLTTCAMTIAPHWTEGAECRLIDRGVIPAEDVRRIDRLAGSDFIHVAVARAGRSAFVIEAKSPSFGPAHLAAHAAYAAAVIAPEFFRE